MIQIKRNIVFPENDMYTEEFVEVATQKAVSRALYDTWGSGAEVSSYLARREENETKPRKNKRIW